MIDCVRAGLLLLLVAIPVWETAQEAANSLATQRIREEGFSHSRVLATTRGLSDLQPPRLAGSPGFLAAVDYAVDRLKARGIPRAGLESRGRRSSPWVHHSDLDIGDYLRETDSGQAAMRDAPIPRASR